MSASQAALSTPGMQLACAQDAETGLWGLIDETGAWKVEPVRKSVRGFSCVQKPYGSRVAVVRAQDASTDLWGYAGTDGQWAVQPAYTSLQAYWA